MITDINLATALATISDFARDNSLTGSQVLDIFGRGHLSHQQEHGALPVPVMTVRWILDEGNGLAKFAEAS